jgi:hypothetical protein
LLYRHTPAAVLADTNIKTTDITVSRICRVHVQVVLGTAGVFSRRHGLAGLATNELMNNGAAIVADTLMTFSFLGHPDDPFNFRTSVGATVKELLVYTEE